MKKRRMVILLIIVFLSTLAVIAKSKPSPGKALVLGIEGGTKETILRSVDGVVVNSLPSHTKWKHEISAGRHKVDFMAIDHYAWGDSITPSEVIEYDFIEGHTYKPELIAQSEKQCMYKIVDVTEK